MFQSAYSIGLLAIFVSSVVVFVPLLFFSAPYGRYGRSGWGPAVAARTAWVVMETPAVVVIAACAFPVLASAAHGAAGHSLVPLLFLLFWETHYVYRTYVFPFLIRGGDKEFPLVLVVFAMIYNSANGYVNGYNLFISGRVYEAGWLLDIRLLVGAGLFVVGFLTHVRSDRTLRELRRGGDAAYAIPRGGLFELVSAPNYFGEIMQWTGWAIMTWSLAGLSFAVFTAANLLPRGIRHHRWYRENFDDYPTERRAVVPYVL